MTLIKRINDFLFFYVHFEFLPSGLWFCRAKDFIEQSKLWQTRKMGRIILSASSEAMCIYILGRPYTKLKVSYRSNTVRFIDFKLEIENRDSMLTENPEFRPAAEERSGTWSPDGELGSSSLACRCFTWRDERRETNINVHLSHPLIIIKPMNSCCQLYLIECGVFPRLLYMHY